MILGEREVELCQEYTFQSNEIFGIYKDIIENIPNIIDLAVPALGITAPNLKQVQQDCLIMNQAKFVITIAIGGNFCMALGSGSKIIGFREDNEPIASYLFDDESYNNIIITKNFDKFISTLKQQLES